MKTIQLRLYKGKELLYDKKGEVKNENQSIKLTDGVEWTNYLKYIRTQQLCKVELLSVIERKEPLVDKDGKVTQKFDPEPVADTSLWKKQLLDACEGVLECEILINSDEPLDSEKTEREVLKAKADEIGISYAKNISTAKLAELLK